MEEFRFKNNRFSPVFQAFFHVFLGVGIKSTESGGKNNGEIRGNGVKKKSCEKNDQE